MTDRLPDGLYLIHWTYEGLPTPSVQPIKSQLVRADRFADVEDWADANVPDGYALATIEKQYAYRDLYERQEADVTIPATFGARSHR